MLLHPIVHCCLNETKHMPCQHFLSLFISVLAVARGVLQAIKRALQIAAPFLLPAF
jgi:hypothetical protein